MEYLNENRELVELLFKHIDLKSISECLEWFILIEKGQCTAEVRIEYLT